MAQRIGITEAQALGQIYIAAINREVALTAALEALIVDWRTRVTEIIKADGLDEAADELEAVLRQHEVLSEK